jgi:AraC-like DNA-binding protein
MDSQSGSRAEAQPVVQNYLVSFDQVQILGEQIIDGVLARIEPLLQQHHAEHAVSREEMAERLDVSLSTLDRLVKQDAIPSFVLNSRRLFSPSEVFAALQASNRDAA